MWLRDWADAYAILIIESNGDIGLTRPAEGDFRRDERMRLLGMAQLEAEVPCLFAPASSASRRHVSRSAPSRSSAISSACRLAR